MFQSPSFSEVPTTGRRLFIALALVAMAGPLAACGIDRTVTSTSLVAEDYHDQHPIILAQGSQTLDIFPVDRGYGLDRATAARLREFAEAYRAKGAGRIAILVPRGARDEASIRRALPAVRRQLAQGGASAVTTSSYPISDPALASPVRLSFSVLTAKVANKCGEWPADLASGSSIDTFGNRPYYNYGCATQNMIATQVSDPRDLVGPRAETPADTGMRSRAILAVRNGTDPTTQWSTHNSQISTVGAN